MKALCLTLKVPEWVSTNINGWYNGYQVKGLRIYNPWAINQCLSAYEENKTLERQELESEVFRSYWPGTGSIEFIREIFKSVQVVRDKLEALLIGEPVSANSFVRNIEVSDFNALRQAVEFGKVPEPDRLVNVFLSYILMAGYLTINSQNAYVIPNK